MAHAASFFSEAFEADPFRNNGHWERGFVSLQPVHYRRDRVERQLARQHLVEGHPQGIEIAAEIDRPVHPARLFGGHVGERSLTGGGLRS